MSDIIIYTDGIAKRITDMSEDEIMKLFSKCLMKRQKFQSALEKSRKIDWKTVQKSMTI